jgi:6-bladed beta-propeller
MHILEGNCFVLLFFILHAATGAIQNTQNTRTQQGNRIIVVENSKTPVPLEGMPSHPVLKEELVIGRVRANETPVFSSVSWLGVDDKENIIVYDAKEVCFKVFDETGKFIHKFGKKGQGPGELMNPLGIGMVDHKFVTVNDSGSNRFAYYSIIGECVKETNRGKYRLLQGLADRDGNIYGITLKFGDMVNQELIKYDSRFMPLKTIASIILPKEPPPAELMERILFSVQDDGSLLWASTYAYELYLHDRNGIPVRKIRKDHDRTKITEENLKKIAPRFYPDRPIPSSFRIPGHWPEHYPVFNALLRDDAGRIYVGLFPLNDGNTAIYDVFDSEGRYFAVLAHSYKEKIAYIENNKVYCLVESDEEGNPLVKRYLLDWK